MKIFSTALTIFLALTLATAQDEYGAENEGWLVDLEEAYQESEQTGKPILANFTGSDWCGWCKRLKAAVFDKPAFKEWAEDNVVLLELDLPKRKQIPEAIRQQNYQLQQQFGVRGYPTIWVFDIGKDPETGGYSISALGKTGYSPSVEDFISGVNQMLDRRDQQDG